jgi:hypothetical protein
VIRVSPKVALLVGIVIQVLIVFLYKMGIGWLFYPGLAWTTLLIVYGLSLRCHVCGAHQVFRGLSIFDLRFPGSKCHRCGAPLYDEEGPVTLGK